MQTTTTVTSQPLTIDASVESQTYALFAFAIGLTVAGVYLGALYMPVLAPGLFLLFSIAELALIFTSGWWSRVTPWNRVLFALFPLLSGFTIAPYLLSVINQYVNGLPILLNALGATASMGLGAAVVARMTGWNLAPIGKALVLGLIGLIVLSLFQLFIPALRTARMELLLSGAGVLLFAAFTAYDLQRIQQQARYGVSPFLLALSLYLDIFNLFLYVLRFMVALSGDRR